MGKNYKTNTSENTKKEQKLKDSNDRKIKKRKTK